MSTIRIGTREERTAYRPGDVIEGAIGWELADPPKAIEVRLFWHTRGKGTEDIVVVDQVRFDQPAIQGAEPFRFTAPDQPYSFSGRLISVIWSLEAVVLRRGPTASLDLIIAPEARE